LASCSACFWPFLSFSFAMLFALPHGFGVVTGS
jgi:hypothetical protein